MRTDSQSRHSYLLESVPARKRRLAQQDPTVGRRRGNTGHGRGNKSSGTPRTQAREGDSSKTKKEKENEGVRKSDDAAASSVTSPLGSTQLEVKDEVFMNDAKQKRKFESVREGKVRTKKVKAAAHPHIPEGDVNDNNNNNSDVKPVVGVSSDTLLLEGVT